MVVKLLDENKSPVHSIQMTFLKTGTSCPCSYTWPVDRVDHEWRMHQVLLQRDPELPKDLYATSSWVRRKPMRRISDEEWGVQHPCLSRLGKFCSRLFVITGDTVDVYRQWSTKDTSILKLTLGAVHFRPGIFRPHHFRSDFLAWLHFRVSFILDHVFSDQAVLAQKLIMNKISVDDSLIIWKMMTLLWHIR